MNCPTCRAPWIDVPSEILEADEDTLPSPAPQQAHQTQTHQRRWSKVPRPTVTWLARPLTRKDSDSSRSTVGGSPGLGFDSASELAVGVGATRHRRRASSLLSDSSSQTKVEPPPALRSILSGAASMSSKNSSGGSGSLAGKRSVKFCDDPVYYDYSYADYAAYCPYPHAHAHAAESALAHAAHCKLGEDCDGGCVAFGYDYDMFSFEPPAAIPSERGWGVLSRMAAWLRRMRRRAAGAGEEEKGRGRGRPVISRPLPLGNPGMVRSAREAEVRRRMGVGMGMAKGSPPQVKRVLLRNLACG